MDTSNDDAIVASLTLLFDGVELPRARELLKRALIPAADQVTFVCNDCGSDKVSYDAVTVYWSEHIQDWTVGEWSDARCWCADCDSEVNDARIMLADKGKFPKE